MSVVPRLQYFSPNEYTKPRHAAITAAFRAAREEDMAIMSSFEDMDFPSLFARIQRVSVSFAQVIEAQGLPSEELTLAVRAIEEYRMFRNRNVVNYQEYRCGVAMFDGAALEWGRQALVRAEMWANASVAIHQPRG